MLPCFSAFTKSTSSPLLYTVLSHLYNLLLTLLSLSNTYFNHSDTLHSLQKLIIPLSFSLPLPSPFIRKNTLHFFLPPYFSWFLSPCRPSVAHDGLPFIVKVNVSKTPTRKTFSEVFGRKKWRRWLALCTLRLRSNGMAFNKRRTVANNVTW